MKYAYQKQSANIFYIPKFSQAFICTEHDRFDPKTVMHWSVLCYDTQTATNVKEQVMKLTEKKY